VRAAVLDCDGVISNTSPLFIEKMDEFVKVMSEAGGLEETKLKADLIRLNNASIGGHGVSPDKWYEIVGDLKKEYPGIGNVVWARAWSSLVDIYNSCPKLFEGAKEALGVLVQGGIGLVMVTHRWRPWHELTMEGQGLRGLFVHEEVVDCHKRKGKKDWEEAMKTARLLPTEVMGAGDSKWGDVRPLWELGVPSENLAYIEAEWSEYAKGELPGGVKTYPTLVNWLKSIANEKK